MKYSARVYLQPDGETVQVFQFKKHDEAPEHLLEGPAYKTVNRSDAEAIGRLIQDALDGNLKQ